MTKISLSHILSSSTIPGSSPRKPLECPSMEVTKAFCSVNKATFCKAPEDGAGCQGNHVIEGMELSV